MRNLVKTILYESILDAPANSSVAYLKKHDIEKYLDSVISVLYLYTRPKKNKITSIFFTEVVVALGNTIRNRLKERRDSGIAARTGALVLHVFEDLEFLRVVMSKGLNGHQSYVIEVLNDDGLRELWSKLDPHQIEKMPSDIPYPEWTTYKHENGLLGIKTGNRDVVKSISPEKHPILFDCLNKSQQTAWRINREIYNIFLWALNNKTEAFNEIWMQTNPEALKTKLREARTIYDIATKFLDLPIYHQYYLDFRGRKYTNTAYLNETGSDAAKGLLKRVDKKPITKDGFYWLMVNLASNAAMSTARDDNRKTDKLPLKDRYEWSVENEELFIAYAENPKVNQGWMKAEKPWQFLAGCIELNKFRKWQTAMKATGIDFDEYGYESSAEAYLDGTTNGSQHLCALTRDETTAPYVNLVPSEYPGDLYAYVATSVWNNIKKELESFSKEEIEEVEGFLDDLIEMKKKINQAEPKSQVRKDFVEDIQNLKQRHELTLDLAAPVFWNRITDDKQKRKIVKR